MKLLTDSRLPEEEHEFFQILNLFFPAIYDVKYLMKSCKNLKVRAERSFTEPEVTSPTPFHRDPERVRNVPSVCSARKLKRARVCVPLPGRSPGSGGPAGAEADWPAAPGRVGLPAHGHGLLQDEGGTPSM